MYQALYRKWRPKTFDDVYGQGHITKTLLNELTAERISHAYLFTGSRGTGKTTCAKILSKAVNCLHPVNGNPCNECEICRGIDNDSIFDVIEIDAASNNGVDNIRDIRDEVNFTPAQCKYRVYIIDEVHMLSPGAFNALLKTLEEPPSHVIFILATTEVHKLPATVLSRCQRFDFRRIPADDIIARLQWVAEKENITLSRDAASLIARISDGGMRDALSILDRCLAISDNIDEKCVSSTVGTAGTEHLFEFSSYIAANDIAGGLTLVSRLYNDACETDILCKDLINHFRNLMIVKSVQNPISLLLCSKEETERLAERATQFDISRILECIEILESTLLIIKNSQSKKIHLESAVIKMCMNGQKQASVPAAAAPVQQPAPQAPKESPASAVKETVAEGPAVASIKPIELPKTYPDGNFYLWSEVIEILKTKDGAMYSLMFDSKAQIFDSERLVIYTDNNALYNYIVENKENRINLLKILFDLTGIRFKISISDKTPPKTDENSEPSMMSELKKKVDEFNA